MSLRGVVIGVALLLAARIASLAQAKVVYKNTKVIAHLQSLQERLKTVELEEAAVGFSGWSNADVAAGAERERDSALRLIERVRSDIDNLQVVGYSTQELFELYANVVRIQSSAATLPYEAMAWKKGGTSSAIADLMNTATSLKLEIEPLETDVSELLQFQDYAMQKLENSSPPAKP